MAKNITEIRRFYIMKHKRLYTLFIIFLLVLMVGLPILRLFIR